jgi:hypothetical protein
MIILSVYKRIFLTGIAFLLISSCNESSKQLADTDGLITEDHTTLSESFASDSSYSLLSGDYDFLETVVNSLPINSAEYFSSIKFPYYYPKSLSLDYSCNKIPFELKDFYIFNKKNRMSACEYVALIDTVFCSKIIARQCIEMENWIFLCTVSKDYRIIDFELLMVEGGSVDDSALKYNGKTIEYIDYIDSLKFSHNIYIASRSEMYTISLSDGKIIEDLGFQKAKIIKIEPDGQITCHDSVSVKKDYIDKYEDLNNYRFK